MSKEKINNTKVASSKDGVFMIRSSSSFAIGKLIDCQLPTKAWSDRYKAYYEEAIARQQLMSALSQKIRETEDMVQAAYKDELTTLEAKPLPKPAGKLNKLYTVKMRVVKQEDNNYIVEPASKKSLNKLAKIGY